MLLRALEAEHFKVEAKAGEEIEDEQPDEGEADEQTAKAQRGTVQSGKEEDGKIQESQQNVLPFEGRDCNVQETTTEGQAVGEDGQFKALRQEQDPQEEKQQ